MTSMVSTDARSTPERHTLPPSMIERVSLIMDCFDRPHTRRALEQIAQQTGLPRSTAYRILEQLVRLRWLRRTASGYRLGERALCLGGRETGHDALRAAAAPVLFDLALRTELVVHLAVLDGPEVYYLDKVGGRAAADIPSRVGGRAPASCTALGKAMLAWLPPEQIDTEYSPRLVRRTPRSIGEGGVLHQQLGRIRRAGGVAYERGECVPGIGCAAAAVRGPDGPIGAISLVGASDAALERVAPQLIQAVRTVSGEMHGYLRTIVPGAHVGQAFAS
ncbi:IclR family transcriptional regulator [Nocardia sp. NEAU-G5]|uniref:IclR family transcriptional regulator n=1 Tax=Nocardia albiluteola TaxID=2842303 RepID=A0ABS6B1X4_9NOCA|nr:IclR family transcriptional regulator [Nocardia albiluteola]MBU3064294.1 IclR family transcriptional regulator [Nocardia albiluteola]